MSSVPGPIISFRIDTSGISQINSATQGVAQTFRAQMKAAADQSVAEWQRVSSQLRASLSAVGTSEVRTLEQITGVRNQIVATVSREISLLQSKDSLTRKELADLKAMTYEREKQLDAIKRGQSVGVTSGTSSALGNISFQTTQGIERIVDSLVNRYLGGAAGALTRTIRDVSYYAGQAGGATGGSGIAGTAAAGGLFGNLSNGLKIFTSAIPAAALAVGALTAAETGLVAVGLSVTKSLADQAQAINTVAAASGLTSMQVQEYTRLSEEMGGGASNLTAVFARLQGQLGEYIISGKSADESTQKFVKALAEMGISVTDSGNKLRPINDILEDLGSRLQTIPDVATRNATAFAALGPRGRELVEIFNQASLKGETLKQALQGIANSGDIISQSQIDNLQKVKNSFDDFGHDVEAQWLRIKESIAGAFLQAAHIQDILPKGDLQQQAQQQAIAELRASQKPLVPGQSVILNPDAIKAQIEAILGGEKNTYAIEKARTEAVKELNAGNLSLALHLAEQYRMLKAISEEEQKRKQIFDQFSKSPSRPNDRTQTLNYLLGNLINGPVQPPFSTGIIGGKDRFGGPVSLGGLTGFSPTAPTVSGNPVTDLLASVKTNLTSPDNVEALQKLNRQWFEDTKSTVDKINQEFAESANYFKIQLDLKRITFQDFNASMFDLAQIQEIKVQDLQKETLDKFKHESDSLFDDLVSGNAKGFAKALQKDLEDVVLGPIKQKFQDEFSGFLFNLNTLISGPLPVSATRPGLRGGPAGATSITSAGGILSRLFSSTTSPVTPPFFGGSIPGLSGGIGQKQFSTQTMLVTAGSVNIGGGTSGTGASGGSGGLSLGIPGVGSINLGGASTSTAGIGASIAQFGSFLGNNNPAALPLNLNQYGGVPGLSLGGATFGSSGGSSLFSALSPFLGAGGLIGASLAGHSITGAISGVGSLATAGVSTLSTLGKISPALAKSLGGAFAGGSLLAGGIETGGVSGGLQDLAGGAELGASLGSIVPGLGTAVGAAVGAIAGGITGIFRGLFGESYKNKVATYEQYHNYVAPPSETFQFASNGSIASTLATGFAQSGNRFSQFALPSGTPFSASAFTGELTPAELALLLQQGSISSSSAFGSVLNPNQGGRVATGSRAFGNPSLTAPQVNVHFHLPGYVDANTTMQALGPAMDQITQTVVSKFRQSSSGLGSTVRALANLP